jgi:enamine deaminase RidA (YjgF/YER057c/UK114 family)
LRSLFSNLKKILDATGSDWSHLAKATYYFSDDAASAAHNAQRPDYYNPQRPPAASKAKVKGVGPSAHGINLDMIAVPAE